MTPKYFSMNSARPGKIAIVPAQAAPQLQRAARRFHLSRAAMAETTAPGAPDFDCAKFHREISLRQDSPGGDFNRRRPLLPNDFTGGIYACLAPLAKPHPIPTSTLRRASGRASQASLGRPRSCWHRFVRQPFSLYSRRIARPSDSIAFST
jgi:hypothetical protein